MGAGGSMAITCADRLSTLEDISGNLLTTLELVFF